MISTVNIQHLESVNDVVNRITGVVQRETVPDAVVRRADQIELVDMSPEALQRRMAHGNIYTPEKVDAALGNYFRAGNLGALRELALLWVADRVEDSLQAYMGQHGIAESVGDAERVIVALTGAPGGDDLIRRAARMARRTQGRPARCARRRAATVSRARCRIRSRGTSGWSRSSAAAGTTSSVTTCRRRSSRSPTAQQATQIVLGTSRRSRWTELTQGSIINRVVREAKGIDVHVIATEDAVGRRSRRPSVPIGSAHRRRAIG